MDLKEFTSPLPKPWLTVNADTINTNTFNTTNFTATNIEAATIADVYNFTYSSLVAVEQSTAVTLTAAQVVNGILYVSKNGSLVTPVLLPTAADLGALQLSNSIPSLFFLNIMNNSNNDITFNFPPSSGLSTLPAWIGGLAAHVGPSRLGFYGTSAGMNVFI